MSTIVVTQERPDSPDAAALIGELESVLEPLYPRESRHGYSVEMLISQGVDFFVLRSDGVAVACGGILFVPGVGEEPAYGEVKRMYVRPAFRGAGFARQILRRLEDHARERGIAVLRLETGIHQEEAIALYERMGFTRIGPFGPYTDDPLSRLYEKRLA